MSGIFDGFSLFGKKKEENKPNSFGTGLDEKETPKPTSKAIEMGSKLEAFGNTVSKRMKLMKKTAELNKELTKSFYTNTEIIVNITKLLNEYKNIFDVMDKIVKQYKEIDIGNADMSHLKYITQDQMSKLKQEFDSQTSNIKQIFTELGKNDKVKAITDAQENMSRIGQTASEIVASDPSLIAPKASSGGKPRKPRVKKYLKKK